MSERNDQLERLACRAFDADLPAYLEGEDRPGITSHARECAPCGVVLADLEWIRNEAGALLLEDPPATVWANVRATLAAEGLFREPKAGWLSWLSSFAQPGWTRYAAPVGVAALTVIVALILTFRNITVLRHLSENPSPQAGLISNPVSVNAEYVKSIEKMEQSYRERAKDLDPAVQQSYQKGLQSLDASIRECTDTVQKEPTDTVAREYLTAAYQQKAAVLFTALENDGR